MASWSRAAQLLPLGGTDALHNFITYSFGFWHTDAFSVRLRFIHRTFQRGHLKHARVFAGGDISLDECCAVYHVGGRILARLAPLDCLFDAPLPPNKVAGANVVTPVRFYVFSLFVHFGFSSATVYAAVAQLSTLGHKTPRSLSSLPHYFLRLVELSAA